MPLPARVVGLHDTYTKRSAPSAAARCRALRASPARGGSTSTTAGRSASSARPASSTGCGGNLSRGRTSAAWKPTSWMPFSPALTCAASIASSWISIASTWRARRASGSDERADAAVQVHGGPVRFRGGEPERRRVELLAHGAVGLQERGGRHAQVDAGDALAEVRRAEQHVGAVADGGVGGRVVDGDGERRAAGLGRDALDELGLFGEARGDEQVEEQVAAGAPLAHDQVAQQAPVIGAPEGAQPEGAAGVGDGQPRPVHALGGQPAVHDVDDLAPGAALVQAQHEASPRSSSPNENSILLR